VHLGASSSYVVDPIWQRKFSIIWASFVGLAVILSFRHVLRAILTRRAFIGLFGIWEDMSGRQYDIVQSTDEKSLPSRKTRNMSAVLSTATSCFLWSPMGFGLNVGQSKIV